MNKLQEVTLAYDDGKTFTAFRRDDGRWAIQPESSQMWTDKIPDQTQIRESDLLLEVACAVGATADVMQPTVH